jgi:hypothetical protein
MLVVAPWPSRAGAQPLPLEEKLRKEAPEGWARYTAFWQTLQGGGTGERIQLPAQKVTVRNVGQWKQCEGYSLNISELYASGSYAGSVTGYNPQYRFALTRDSPEKPWVIKDYARRSPDDPPPPQYPIAGLYFANPVMQVTYVLKSPGFKLLNLATVPGEDGEYIRVTFSYSPQDKDEFLRGGWLDLDPSHDWVIRRGEVQIGDGARTSAKQTFHYEYKQGSGHHLVPTRDEMITRGTDGTTSFSSINRGTYDLHEQKEVPEREFTLSAFDLPEPPWYKPPRPRWYIWAAVGGFSLLLAAFVAWTFLRRPRTDVRPKSSDAAL